MTPKVKKAIEVLLEDIGYERLISEDFKHMVMVVDMEVSDKQNAKDIKEDIIKYLNDNHIDKISSKKLYNALNKKFNKHDVKLTISKYKNELWKFEKIEGTKRSFEFVFIGENNE